MAQRRLTIWFAAAGVLLVAGASACVAYAFGPRTGPEFWLLAVTLALTPYAVVTVALGTAGASRWARGVVGLAALFVLLAGLGLLRDVFEQAQVRSTINFTRELGHLSWAATDWLFVQGIAALVAALASGPTWDRRPRYGLWFLFAASFLAFALLVDYCELLGRSAVFDCLRVGRSLDANWSQWHRHVSRDAIIGLGRVLLPAVCLGWLAQRSVPRRRRRDADLRADYADPPASHTAR